MKTIKYLVLLLLILTGCKTEPSDSVDQDKIYATYELYYDKNRDKSFVRATFQFSNGLGTKLQLSSPSEVKFNNDVLTYNALLGYYEREYAGLIISGSFRWVDTKGKVFVNPVSGIKPIQFPTTMPTIRRGSSTEIFWVGDAIGTDERIAVSMNSSAAGDLQIFTRNDLNASSIILSANQIQNLPTNQNITTIIRRYKDIPVVQKTSAGAVMFTHYQGSDIITQILP